MLGTGESASEIIDTLHRHRNNCTEIIAIIGGNQIKTMMSVDNYPSQLTALQKRVWVSAHILYMNNIYAALAGPPTAAFYGSDTSIFSCTSCTRDIAAAIAQARSLASAYRVHRMLL